MCGRFTQKFTWPELIELYRLTQTPPNPRPNYNVCPTDPISVIIPGEKGLFLMPMRWGLIPRWWEEIAEGTPGDLQCQSRVGCRQTDVPGCVQEKPLPPFPPLGILSGRLSARKSNRTTSHLGMDRC
jgi:putative SOS response-associated peptidase YedK